MLRGNPADFRCCLSFPAVPRDRASPLKPGFGKQPRHALVRRAALTRARIRACEVWIERAARRSTVPTTHIQSPALASTNQPTSTPKSPKDVVTGVTAWRVAAATRAPGPEHATPVFQNAYQP